MTILCIETSTSICSAAICIDGKPAEQYICSEGGNHARLLPRYIEQLLQSAKHHGWTIDAIAVSEGPGSYTGLRIGTSTAKGLCYGLNIPLIPIPTLQIIAAAALEKIADHNALLCPMIDARRMEVYTAFYTTSLQSTTPVQAAIIDEPFAQQPAAAPIYYFGDGAAKCQSLLTQWHFIPDIVPQAQYMGALAEKAEKHITGAEIAYYEPFYLKEFVAAQSHVKGLK
jgi:tRNA threonylcarbamoyladenosine biosynthesis protein TsaB